MDLLSYALVSLDNAKVFLGINDNSKDELLKMLINISTDYIESQTGRRFVSAVHTQEKYDGTGNQQLKLNAFPIITFTLLEVNNASDNSSSWNTISSSDYWVDSDTGIITRTSTFLDFDESVDGEETLSETIFDRGKNKYRATYISGYFTIPYDLQFACMTLVGQLLNTKAGSGIKSESLGDHSITYQDITELTGGVKGGILEDILSKYRDIPLAS
jgi:hypothetical protein